MLAFLAEDILDSYSRVSSPLLELGGASSEILKFSDTRNLVAKFFNRFIFRNRHPRYCLRKIRETSPLVHQIRFWQTSVRDPGCRQLHKTKKPRASGSEPLSRTAIIRPEYLKACERRSALNCCLRVRRRCRSVFASTEYKPTGLHQYPSEALTCSHPMDTILPLSGKDSALNLSKCSSWL